MFKSKYFWRGYLLGFAIALIIIGYFSIKVSSKRPIEEMKGFEKITFVNIKGDTLHLNTAGSNPVFINYWATYCGPCIREMPLLLSFSKKNPNIKVWLLTNESSDVINKFIIKHPDLKELNFAHLLKSGRTLGMNNINNILPSSFLVNSNGIVLWKNDGMLMQRTPEELLDSIKVSFPKIKI